jgi:hypothetical protein
MPGAETATETRDPQLSIVAPGSGQRARQFRHAVDDGSGSGALEQAAERVYAANLWQDDGWAFAQPTGKPVDPRADYGEWKELLSAAGVREARLHDARHTAATFLLVLGVSDRAAMDVVGLVKS